MKRIYLFTVCGLLFIIPACRPDLKHPPSSSGDADFSKFVALGGNFMAGYQDGSLYADGQKYAIPALLSKQFEWAGGGSFNQPLIPDNSGLGMNPKPWESEYQTLSKLGYKTDCEGISAMKPVKNLFSGSSAGTYVQHQTGSFQNISVPFAKVSGFIDASMGVSGGANPYYARFAGNPGVSTMLSDAKAQQPGFFALWTGMEDIYEYARNGGYNQTILSAAAFDSYLDTICGQINTKGAIANIPDLTSFPFYTLIPWNGLDLTKNQADSLNLTYGNWFNFTEGKNGFVIADTANINGYRKMTEGEYILLTVPLDSIKCHGMGFITMEIPGRYVLDVHEVNVIKQAIADYNTVIAAKAQQYNLALADMNTYFKSVVEGIKWNGVDFNAVFVSGGFFSLDGYHPNQKGYALIANEFIKTINSTYKATVPAVNCVECSGIKFP